MAQDASKLPHKRRLTYGRLLTVMAVAIALAIALALTQSLLISNHLNFNEIGYEMLAAAQYGRSELTRAELEKHRGASGKIQGTVIYVKTSEGNWAKLAAEFSHRFWSPKLQFVIYQGEVFDQQGRRIGDPFYNRYMQLQQRFDLDAVLTSDEGASELGVDLAFVERAVADQSVLTVNGARLALPKAEELRR